MDVIQVQLPVDGSLVPTGTSLATAGFEADDRAHAPEAARG